MPNYFYPIKQRALAEIKKSDKLFELAKALRRLYRKPVTQKAVKSAPAKRSKATEKKSEKDEYAEFLHLFRLKNYLSAAQVAHHIKKEKLGDKALLNVVQCYYSSTQGIEADFLLEKYLDKITSGETNLLNLIPAADKILVSGFSYQDKLAKLRSLRALESDDLVLDNKNKAHIDLLEYRIRSGTEINLDPSVIVGPKEESCPMRLRSTLKFLPYLRAYGHELFIKDVLAKLYSLLGFSDIAVLRSFISFWPSWFTLDTVKGFPGIAEADLAVMIILYGQLKTNPLFEPIFQRCLEVQRERFHTASEYERDSILRAFIRVDHFDLVSQLDRRYSLPREMLPKYISRGFEYFESDDYYSARECFLRVLKEDPSDTLAASGLRLVLPRTGADMGEILRFRSEFGYGVAGSGRAGVRVIGSELIIAHLMGGAYVKGLFSKRKAGHWVKLESYYGDKFLNYRQLPINPSSNSLFVIGDEGVGDEIRTAQFYSELADSYNKVIISCDPRLVNIFSKSFPRIEFIPVRRFRKGVSEPDNEDQPRFAGIDYRVSNFLTEECRTLLESSDYVTFGQNLFFNRFSGNLACPSPGAYLKWSEPERDQVEINAPFKVGLLWRSHFKSRMRDYMYLELEEFSPLLDVPGVEFWSVQHCMDEKEREFCVKHGIKLIEDIDLFNDFEGLSTRLQELDLLIGISSVPIELGAAFGVEVWMLGFSPENYYLRTAGGRQRQDQYTMNSKVIAPPAIDFSEPRRVCVQQVFVEACRELTRKVRGI